MEARMVQRIDRGRIAGSVVLILLGAWFLAVQLVPGLRPYVDQNWPFAVIGAGALLALVSLATWVPGLMVPAAIVTGIGAILYFQALAQDYESWAYAWALIPGFVGVGVLISELMRGRPREALFGAAWLILISFTLFLIFGSLVGRIALFGTYWPLLLVGLGLILLVQSFMRRR